MFKKTAVAIGALALFGCATPDRSANQAFLASAKAESDAALKAYYLCGYAVADTYAPQLSFLPQDIAAAAVSECRSYLSDYRKASERFMTASAPGPHARDLITRSMPRLLSDAEEINRNSVISRVLSQRTKEPPK